MLPPRELELLVPRLLLEPLSESVLLRLEEVLEVRVEVLLVLELLRLVVPARLEVFLSEETPLRLEVPEVREDLLSEETPLRLVELELREELLSEETPLRLVELELREELLSVEAPLRLVLPVPREVLLSEETPLRLVVPVPRELLLSLRLLTSPVRLGAALVVRLPETRSVVVIVFSPRLLVMRLPLRWVGSFCTRVWERVAVMLPTSGSLV